MSKVSYLSAIGSLMYAMMCTRPNICPVVGMAGCHAPKPTIGRDDHFTP